MTVIKVTDDEGDTLTYDEVPLEVFAAVMHALSGAPAATFSRESGACLCNSFSQERDPDYDGGWAPDGRMYRCGKCKHAVHNTRAHCGALR